MIRTETLDNTKMTDGPITRILLSPMDLRKGYSLYYPLILMLVIIYSAKIQLIIQASN